MFTAAIALLLSYPLMFLRLCSAGSFPKPLTAEEEREYIERLANGDTEARNILIEKNLRLVAHIIKKYYSQTNEQDDLISIGTIGLIKGISTYKVERGVRLATYASRCIENEILMYFRGIKKTAGDLSLSDSLDVDGDGNSLSIMDVICTDEDILEKINLQEMYKDLRGFIEKELDPREKKIIGLRYGLGGGKPQTQKEVAASCGISRSYVSRIEKKAIEKLKAAFERNDLF